MLVFCYLLNLLDLIWVLLYESLTFSFNHSLWLMFKQAKASGEMSSWKMHDSPSINHIKSWATCFLRVVFWEDPWLFYRAGRANLMFFSSFVLRTYIYIYITSTETILLTVWSHSLLTWPLNRRREYNKQGQSKSNPPSTRCRFGKLYPGKWSFLKPFVVILSIMLQNSSPPPITKFTNGIDSSLVSLWE